MFSFDAYEGSIDESQKEVCAILAMRTMLEDYTDAHGVPFNEALLTFARTDLYAALFDYSTRLWAEGPAYLMGLFEQELGKR